MLGRQQGRARADDVALPWDHDGKRCIGALAQAVQRAGDGGLVASRKGLAKAEIRSQHICRGPHLDRLQFEDLVERGAIGGHLAGRNAFGITLDTAGRDDDERSESERYHHGIP